MKQEEGREGDRSGGKRGGRGVQEGSKRFTRKKMKEGKEVASEME